MTQQRPLLHMGELQVGGPGPRPAEPHRSAQDWFRQREPSEGGCRQDSHRMGPVAAPPRSAGNTRIQPCLKRSPWDSLLIQINKFPHLFKAFLGS